jgi:hypothetical protein
MRKSAEQLEPATRPYSVWFDGEGYSVEDERNHVVAYFGLDLTGEGDFAEWNEQQRYWAHSLRGAMNEHAAAETPAIDEQLEGFNCRAGFAGMGQ